MYKLLISLLILSFSAYAEVATRVDDSNQEKRTEYQCIELFNNPTGLIKKKTSKLVFRNGFITFNKKSLRKVYLTIPAGVWCVGDSLTAPKTFGRGVKAKIKRLNFD